MTRITQGRLIFHRATSEIANCIPIGRQAHDRRFNETALHETQGVAMKKSYLEVTFRNGKPQAAYLYLPRHSGDVSTHTEKQEGGIVVDFAADGRPIGIEITSPRSVSISAINRIVSLVDEPARPADLAPLGAVA
jgi:hypothetical protein